ALAVSTTTNASLSYGPQHTVPGRYKTTNATCLPSVERYAASRRASSTSPSKVEIVAMSTSAPFGARATSSVCTPWPPGSAVGRVCTVTVTGPVTSASSALDGTATWGAPCKSGSCESTRVSASTNSSATSSGRTAQESWLVQSKLSRDSSTGSPFGGTVVTSAWHAPSSSAHSSERNTNSCRSVYPSSSWRTG